MKFSTGVTLAALVSIVSARSIAINRRQASLLQVKLEQDGNSGVKASVKNTGATGLNLLKRSTLLDDIDVEKIEVTSNGQKVPFSGIQLALAYESLPKDAFTFIGAGQTMDVAIDTAELHDLSSGGTFELQARGVIPYAEANSTTLTGMGYPFQSNLLTITVDGDKAGSVHKSFQKKHARAKRSLSSRAVVQPDCQGEQLAQIQQAAADCSRVAGAAAGAVRGGSPDKFAEFFRTVDQGTRDYAASRFDAMAAACSSTTEGIATVQCTPPPDFPCSDGVLAFALVPGDAVTLCPGWFGSAQDNADCHGQDKWSTLLHEFTHCGGVFPPATSDFAYFYDGITQLSPEQARDNADTYALYAHAINLNC